MLNIDNLFLSMSIVLTIFTLIFIFLSINLTIYGMKKKIIGDIFNIKYKQFAKFWNWIFLIPFTILVARLTEFGRSVFGIQIVFTYRIFDFIIVLIVFITVASYYFLMKEYIKK